MDLGRRFGQLMQQLVFHFGTIMIGLIILIRIFILIILTIDLAAHIRPIHGRSGKVFLALTRTPYLLILISQILKTLPVRMEYFGQAMTACH
jgi:hypothetical protein